VSLVDSFKIKKNQLTRPFEKEKKYLGICANKGVSCRTGAL